MTTVATDKFKTHHDGGNRTSRKVSIGVMCLSGISQGQSDMMEQAVLLQQFKPPNPPVIYDTLADETQIKMKHLRITLSVCVCGLVRGF